MKFVNGVTKFHHKKFGDGILVDIKNGNYIINFASEGEKTLASNTIEMGLLKVIKDDWMPDNIGGTDMGDFLQYDSSNFNVGGKNVAEAISSEKKILYNESYIVVGDLLSATSIHASYDLTVLGDLKVDELTVNGDLFVSGSLDAKNINCLKSITCGGDIDAQRIMVGNDLIAANIYSLELICSGSIIAKSVIDISESLEAEKNVYAGEGLIGNGRFSAPYTVLVEYFDFDGEIKGKVIELDTDERFDTEMNLSVLSLDELFPVLQDKLSELLLESKDGDEQKLLESVLQISSYDNRQIGDWYYLTKHVINISYLDEITNFRDYLFMMRAYKVLPKEILSYETLEHVFQKLLPNAINNVATMDFRAETIDEFILSLKIVVGVGDELHIDKDEALDRIFQSVGIKYKTVKTYLNK